MPRRRPFGSVYRRRKRPAKPGQRAEYYPGYYIRIRKDGREVTKYAGLQRATAVEVLERYKREAERLELLDELPERARLFSEFVPEYMAYSKRTHTLSTHRTRRSLVERILEPYFGKMKLQEIRSLHIERFLNSRTEVTPATRNRSLGALSAMFQRAMELGLVRSNPVRDVRRGKETVQPLPLVSLEDQNRLLAAVEEPLRAFLTTALETGARLSELLALEWRDVDFRDGTIQIRRSKNKRPRILRMSRRLKHTLAAHGRAEKESGSEVVFATAQGGDGALAWSWRKRFKAAAKRVGHPDLRIHDLRHVTAINLVRAGLDLPAIQIVLGHKNLVSTLRYASYADDAASARAAEVLNRIHADAETDDDAEDDDRARKP